MTKLLNPPRTTLFFGNVRTGGGGAGFQTPPPPSILLNTLYAHMLPLKVFEEIFSMRVQLHEKRAKTVEGGGIPLRSL